MKRIIECCFCDGSGAVAEQQTVAGDVDITVYERCTTCGGTGALVVKDAARVPAWVYVAVTLFIAVVLGASLYMLHLAAQTGG